jgi:hypothetical protein
MCVFYAVRVRVLLFLCTLNSRACDCNSKQTNKQSINNNNNKMAFAAFGEIAELEILLHSKDFKLNDTMKMLDVKKIPTRFGQRLCSSVEFKGLNRKLIFPEKYAGLSDENIDELMEIISKGVHPIIKVIRRAGTGWVFDIAMPEQ